MVDWIFGEGPSDNFRMLIFNIVLANHYSSGRDPNKPLLFNVKDDPEEKFNIADKMPSVVEDLLKDIAVIKAKRPKHPKYWLNSWNWTAGFVTGDCSEQGECQTICRLSQKL